MKKIFTILVLSTFVMGCTATDPRLHPNSTPNVIDFGGMQEFTMKAPTQTVRDAQGNVTEGPVFETIVTTEPSTGKVVTTTRPILVSLKIKDQTMRAPVSGMDVFNNFVSFLPSLGFGWLAADVAKKGISSASKDPLVTTQTNNNPVIISTSDGSYESGVIYP